MYAFFFVPYNISGFAQSEAIKIDNPVETENHPDLLPDKYNLNVSN